MTKPRSIFSSACNPLKLVVEGEHDADGRKMVLFCTAVLSLLALVAFGITVLPHSLPSPLHMDVKAQVQDNEIQKIEAYLAAHACTVHDLNGIVVNSFLCTKPGGPYNISARDVRTTARAGTAPIVELLRAQTATTSTASAKPAAPAARLQFPNDQ